MKLRKPTKREVARWAATVALALPTTVAAMWVMLAVEWHPIVNRWEWAENASLRVIVAVVVFLASLVVAWLLGLAADSDRGPFRVDAHPTPKEQDRAQ